jgi:hypothetical protein
MANTQPNDEEAKADRGPYIHGYYGQSATARPCASALSRHLEARAADHHGIRPAPADPALPQQVRAGRPRGSDLLYQ